MSLIFRLATLPDLQQIMPIIKAAVSRMLAEGKCQWSESYPEIEHITADILTYKGYVLEENGTVMAYGAVAIDGEPAYADIDGEWLTDTDNYVVVHRLAVAQHEQMRGLGRKFLQAVAQIAATKGFESFRIDTNFDNERMLALLSRCGFEYTGRVHYPQGERQAFEKLI